MSDKNPIAKSEAYAERFNFSELITLDERNNPQIDKAIYEKTALVDAGLTPEQVKKLRKSEGELYPAVALFTANLVKPAFVADPNLTEVGFNFDMGGHKASGVINREGPQHFVGAITHEYKNAETKRVISYIDDLFNGINT